jgi:Leucine-rich repeat (LRR) protein
MVIVMIIGAFLAYPRPKKVLASDSAALAPRTASDGASSTGAEPVIAATPAPAEKGEDQSLLDPALPVAFRELRDEWIIAFEIVTGEKWTSKSPVGPALKIPGVDDPLDRAIRTEGSHVIGLDLARTSLTDERLSRFKSLPQLKYVWLAGADLDGVTEKGIAALAECKRLEVIDLHEQAVSDEYLTHIGKCPALTVLDLHKTRVTDQGIKRLDNPLLTQLDLSGTKVTEVGLAEVGRFTKLERLSFKGAAVRDWSYLPHLKSLERLADFGMVLPEDWAPAAKRSYMSTEVVGGWEFAWRHYSRGRKRPGQPDAWSIQEFPSKLPRVEGRQLLEAISGMVQLQEVDLGFAECRDEDLKLLGKLENLRVLDLSHSNIGAAGLAHLTPLKKLKYLDLSGTPLRYEDLRTLKAIPSLTDVGVNDTDLSKKEVQKLEEELTRVKFWSNRLRRQ